MIRTNFHITDSQMGVLRHESECTGLSISEIVRRAIDYYTGNIPVLNKSQTSAIDSALAPTLQRLLEQAREQIQIMESGDFVKEEEFDAGLNQNKMSTE